MTQKQNDDSSRSKLTISDWAVQDRPREKYLASGFSSLSDTELIAILLRNGTKNASAVDVARNLMSSCQNNLKILSETPMNKLIKINGIGKVKAITLQVVFELGKRCRAATVEEKRKLRSPLDSVKLMQTKNAYLNYEECWAIFVNSASDLLGMENVGKGHITGTAVDIRRIVQKGLELQATGIILCHNHPSGSLKPSKLDLNLTSQVKNAAQLLGIELLDHLIICKEEYYSFFENSNPLIEKSVFLQL
jgi:DNA repair protein RadC